MRIVVSNPLRADTEITGAEIKNPRLSAFCIEAQTDDGMLLCHAATGEMVQLNDREYREIASGSAMVHDWVL